MKTLNKHALPIAIIINVIAIGIMTGCESKEGYKSDRRNLEGCVPTAMYVWEMNPRMVRQVYVCGE